VKSSSTSLVKLFGDSLRFALLLDCHFPPLMHLDAVHLGRPLVERPQVSVDADFRYQTLVENFDGGPPRPWRRLAPDQACSLSAPAPALFRAAVSATNRATPPRRSISGLSEAAVVVGGPSPSRVRRPSPLRR